jgi:hypothetical protein
MTRAARLLRSGVRLALDVCQVVLDLAFIAVEATEPANRKVTP